MEKPYAGNSMTTVNINMIVHKIGQVFFGVLLAGTLISCSTDRNLKSVRIMFGPEYSTVIVPITCESIHYYLIGVKRKNVVESEFLHSLDRELSKLRYDSINDLSTKSIDIRIKCFLEYQRKTDTLCLGAFSGIIFNGELMNDNQDLLKLLKSEIYVAE